MTDDQQIRGTSAAKNVDGLTHQESALDRARALKEQFNRAASHQEQQQSKETEQSKGSAQQGSQMVKKDAPPTRPKPPSPMLALDRQAAHGNVAKERSAEDRKIEAAKIAQQFRDRQGKSNDHDHDHER
jgi:hypothetical protein